MPSQQLVAASPDGGGSGAGGGGVGGSVPSAASTVVDVEEGKGGGVNGSDGQQPPPPPPPPTMTAAAAPAAPTPGTGPASASSSLYSEADKAPELRLCACGTVPTIAFHLAWTSFFVAFWAWFAIPPLLSVIRPSLGLTQQQVQYSHLASIGTTLLARLAVGPYVDFYGPKTTMAALLFVGALPFFFTPLVRGWRGLVALRACVGVLGASFVMSQAWTTAMFQRKIVGKATALAGGWGNIGGGAAQIVMVEIYHALLPRHSNPDGPSAQAQEAAWRHALLVPPAALVLAALVVYFMGTDTPRGDVAELKRRGERAPPPAASLVEALKDYRAWVLALQYAVSFGVELVALNLAASYFHEQLGTPVVTAGRLATYGGATNLVTRVWGGWLSDRANATRWRVKGRLGVQFVLVVAEGAFLLRFAAARSQGAAAVYLLLFSAFVQAANGSCFALCPYLSSHGGGVIAGLVSCGGNLGSIAFTLMFAQAGFASNPARGFAVMGWTALACAPTIWLIRPGALEAEAGEGEGEGEGAQEEKKKEEGEEGGGRSGKRRGGAKEGGSSSSSSEGLSLSSAASSPSSREGGRNDGDVNKAVAVVVK